MTEKNLGNLDDKMKSNPELLEKYFEQRKMVRDNFGRTHDLTADKAVVLMLEQIASALWEAVQTLSSFPVPVSLPAGEGQLVLGGDGSFTPLTSSNGPSTTKPSIPVAGIADKTMEEDPDLPPPEPSHRYARKKPSR